MFKTNELTVEVTIKRYEQRDGKTRYDVYCEGHPITHSSQYPRARLPKPDRRPLIELVQRGREPALKEVR